MRPTFVDQDLQGTSWGKKTRVRAGSSKRTTPHWVSLCLVPGWSIAFKLTNGNVYTCRQYDEPVMNGAFFSTWSTLVIRMIMVFWVKWDWVQQGATVWEYRGIQNPESSPCGQFQGIHSVSTMWTPKFCFLVYCTPLTMVLNHYKLNSEPSFSVFPAGWIHFSWKMALGWSWRLLGETRNSNHAILHETSWKPLLVAMCRRKNRCRT